MKSEAEVQNFEKEEKQLRAFVHEMRKLSEKKPNDAVNEFKLKYINSTLAALNQILGDGKPFPDFETFDTDTLPTNSDVLMMLTQYATSVHTMRQENTQKEDYKWYWIVGKKVSDIETASPDDFAP